MHGVPKNLAALLVETLLNELENAALSNDKLRNLDIQFGFIKTNTLLSTKENLLKELIDEIDENINQFIKTHQYFDFLGQLYIEFLRYANSDKGLGIVLTPPHITELFCDLAQVNKNSVIFDNCAGTGGFLISAMRKMINNAEGDQEKIAEIKSSQLIGIEYQAHIFPLAVSNMFIHQDGKTNIIHGSCFDPLIIHKIKQKKIDTGFLNPPYKSDKKQDTEELAFILNNLDCLMPGGICIALVPMTAALEHKAGKIYALKKSLLKNYTLEAVLSMPDQLFLNSNVGIVSCIMIFTAHKPHPYGKETFFGYYKQDGFEKKKHKGRIDLQGKWQEIKKEWAALFINRKTKPGLSVNKIVAENDEWCAEAYMETDYSGISNKTFIPCVLNYLSFLIKEGRFDLFNNFLASKNSSVMILAPE